jgi:hypothetical protein
MVTTRSSSTWQIEIRVDPGSRAMASRQQKYAAASTRSAYRDARTSALIVSTSCAPRRSATAVSAAVSPDRVSNVG